eukprot:CAMPEP_0204369084 /NCGR_PEP_ID=MMETSP0469-20131031/44688_1 /ASSEMBLY_ACC=CAM_ASM_000384 /TAXON_ID=2969 /ORGANISM="Oxyrrhis marina" /LENGTH=62 /DNA_ID=CAMNT_0051358751 /DNA_START=45 /DNA_END=229 /DNA_ORIENTATION=-
MRVVLAPLGVAVASHLYSCREGGCYPEAAGTYASQQECFAVCGYLWPQPRAATVGKELGPAL